jgi:hypothetical protein
MENFDFKKYLAEGKMLNEEIQEHFLNDRDLQQMNKILFTLYDSSKIGRDEYSAAQKLLQSIDSRLK